jgi:hypothetical protein
MYKKYTTNKAYRELVNPERESNMADTMMRGTRGPSIVLKRETFADSRPPRKDNCCE